MHQQINITIDWPWLLGIFGTALLITWLAAVKFTRIEILLEGLNHRLSGIETSIKDFQSRPIK